MDKILAIIETKENGYKKSSLEIVTIGIKLSDYINAEIDFLVINSETDEIIKDIQNYGAGNVLILSLNELNSLSNVKQILFSHSAIAKAISNIIHQNNYNIILLSATSLGLEIAPKIAVQTDSAYMSNCTEIIPDEGNLKIKKQIFSSKIDAFYSINQKRTIISIRPNSYTPEINKSQNTNFKKIDVKSLEITENDFTDIVKEFIPNTGKTDLTEANIIVSGGLGMQKAENFFLISELAEVLNGSVGASRAVVDNGWRPHSEQIGQTGKTVAPLLYIACGISGSLQHLAGISKSKYIIAINNDKNAPIFKIADYGIVGDAMEILPVLIKEIKKNK